MSKPTKQGHLIIHSLDDELLLYDPQVDRTHRLNESATLIWNNCDGAHTLEDMANQLTEHYDVGFEAALRDTQTLVRQLQRENLLSSAPG